MCTNQVVVSGGTGGPRVPLDKPLPSPYVVIRVARFSSAVGVGGQVRYSTIDASPEVQTFKNVHPGSGWPLETNPVGSHLCLTFQNQRNSSASGLPLVYTQIHV